MNRAEDQTAHQAEQRQRQRCLQITRAIHHLMDGRARLIDAGLAGEAQVVNLLIRKLDPIREESQRQVDELEGRADK